VFIIVFVYFMVLLEVPRIFQKNLSFDYSDHLTKTFFTYGQKKKASQLITLQKWYNPCNTNRDEQRANLVWVSRIFLTIMNPCIVIQLRKTTNKINYID